MKNFNWVMKCERRTDQHGMSVGQLKNPRQESNLWPPEQQVGALSTELKELMDSQVI